MSDGTDNSGLTAEIINRLSHIKDAIVKELGSVSGKPTAEDKKLLELAKKKGAATLAAVEAGIKQDMETATEAGKRALATALVHIASEAGIKLAIPATGGRKASGGGTGTRSRMSADELKANLAAIETAAKSIKKDGITKAELTTAAGVDESKMQTLLKKAIEAKIIKSNGKVGKAGRYLAI